MHLGAVQVRQVPILLHCLQETHCQILFLLEHVVSWQGTTEHAAHLEHGPELHKRLRCLLAVAAEEGHADQLVFAAQTQQYQRCCRPCPAAFCS